MAETIDSLLQTFATRDLEALHSIYQLRCLSLQQIYELHYTESLKANATQPISNLMCKKTLKTMCDKSLLRKETQYFDGEVYFLTQKGVDLVVSAFKIPTDIYTDKSGLKRGCYTAKELDLFPKAIHHQINLNQFVVDFKSKNVDISFKYYDEKYVSQYTQIRPDGMMQMLNTDYFIEMDMSTESQKQLLEKWDNYRSFLNSREYSLNERNIVVLFVVENSAKDDGRDADILDEKIKNRINVVKHTIYESLMDVLYQKDINFEIYVGTKNNLIELVTKNIIPQETCLDIHGKRIVDALMKHQFCPSKGAEFRKALQNSANPRKEFTFSNYGYYIRKLQDETIVIENNRIQEFLFDDFLYSPASVMSKIFYHERNNGIIKSLLKREMGYIVLGESMEQLYTEVKLAGLTELNNIYFTTLERLEASKKFYDALFQFDWMGNAHKFGDSGLQKRIFEKTLGAM